MPNGFTAGTKQPSYPCPRPQFEFQESRSLLSQKAVSLEFRATSTMSIAEVIKKQTNRDTCKNYIYMYVCICVDQLGRPCHILSFGLPGPYVDGFKKDREVIYIFTQVTKCLLPSDPHTSRIDLAWLMAHPCDPAAAPAILRETMSTLKFHRQIDRWKEEEWMDRWIGTWIDR